MLPLLPDPLPQVKVHDDDDDDDDDDNDEDDDGDDNDDGDDDSGGGGDDDDGVACAMTMCDRGDECSNSSSSICRIDDSFMFDCQCGEEQTWC